MQLRLKHSLGFMSIVAVYAPTEGCETEEKEMFCAKLDYVLDQCPCRDALIVPGDFNAVTGTKKAGYEICVSPHGSGTTNNNSSFLLTAENCGFLVSETNAAPLDLVHQCRRGSEGDR